MRHTRDGPDLMEQSIYATLRSARVFDLCCIVVMVSFAITIIFACSRSSKFPILIFTYDDDDDDVNGDGDGTQC